MSAVVVAEPLVVADRCDRCGAEAFFRAVLGGGLELWFCGHHFNEHGASLKADTVVFGKDGAVVTGRS